METLWSDEEWEPVGPGRLPSLRAPGTTEAERVAGMEVEVVPGVLHEDAETIWTTWHWRPTGVRA